MNTPKKIVTGLVIGLVVSVFINTVFIMMTNAWLFIMIFPVLIPTIIICAIFIILAIKNKLMQLSYHALAGILLLGIPLAYFVPVQAQATRFRLFSSSIPKMDETTTKEISRLSVFGADHPAEVSTIITSSKSISSMLEFYSDTLKKDGWKETLPISQYIIRERYTYTKGSSTVHMIGYKGGDRGKTNTVRIRREYPTLGF